MRAKSAHDERRGLKQRTALYSFTSNLALVRLRAAFAATPVQKSLLQSVPDNLDRICGLIWPAVHRTPSNPLPPATIQQIAQTVQSFKVEKT